MQIIRQARKLTADVDIVTISAGGNDVEWSEALEACAVTDAQRDLGDAAEGARNTVESAAESAVNWARERIGRPPIDSEPDPVNPSTVCQDIIDVKMDELDDLEANLTALYAAVSDRTSGAQVFVSNYPLIVAAQSANLLTLAVSDDVARFDGFTQALNDRIASAVDAAGFTLVDIYSAFEGNEGCTGECEYIKCLDLNFTVTSITDLNIAPAAASMHPTEYGACVYAREFAESMLGSGDGVPCVQEWAGTRRGACIDE